MENNLGFIKSPKVLLLLFGVFGILIIAALSVAITNIDKISDESDSTGTLTNKLEERIEKLERSLGPLPDDDEEVCTTSECNQAVKKLTQYMNTDIDPCVDFYEFTCGKWMMHTPLPEGEDDIGTFSYLTNDIKKTIQNILNDPKTEDSVPKSVKLAKSYFKSCTDAVSLEASGEAFFNKWFAGDNELGGYPMLNPIWEESKFDLEKVIAKVLYNFNLPVFLSTQVTVDAKEVDKYIVDIDQGSLGLIPMAHMNVNNTFDDLIKAYKILQVAVLVEMNGNQGANLITPEVEKLIQLEQDIAKIMIPAKDRRDPNKMYNKKKIEELNTEYPNIDWLTHINALLAFGGQSIKTGDSVIIAVPDYFEKLNVLLKNTESKTLSNLVHWRILFQALENGPEKYYDHYKTFMKEGLKVTTLPKKEDYCASLVSAPFDGMGGLGFAVAHEYVKHKFDDSAKTEVNDMVNNLRVAFKEIVDESEWMDEATQGKAKEKVDGIIQSLGYPDWLMDSTKLDERYNDLKGKLKEDKFLENLMEVRKFETLRVLKEFKGKPDRNSWPLHPAVVNAVYSPVANSITFPAGILQYPFFKKGMPSYLNYGSIGVVIGHEITHGFDDQGKEFGGDGTLQSWWSSESEEKFEERAQCIVDQYSDYYVDEIGLNLDGHNTQGENIADNGGLREAFKAFKKAQSADSGSSSKRLSGTLSRYSPEQLFFVAYSQTWCEVVSKTSMENQVLTNVHSPGRFRSVGAVSNSKDFAEAFQCSEKSPMNRGDDRCEVW